jgi:hypothetical protein
MYDIVFISYNEPNADANYERLKARFPLVKRVHGVKGIHQAHIAAAKKCFTKMFWVVDGDAEVLDSFNFDYEVSEFDLECVHVWKSINPINGLEYGYGGVKLLPRKLTMQVDVSAPDMTTSISPLFKAMPKVSNITAFNTDPFSAWRSAFRECAKLSSSIIDRQNAAETLLRLETWCTKASTTPYAENALNGAIAGRAYGQENAANKAALSLINDFDWLQNQFTSQLK